MWPALRVLPHIRALKGKEKRHRIGERFGKATISRPDNKQLVWIHAASNGEALSALPLIDYLNSLDTPPHILMTTMTVTAADLIQKRVAPDNFTHQFIPYDHPQWVKKFHDHWRPDFVFWMESELWPNHLRFIRDNNIPAILANARLSDKSVKRWALFQSSFKAMMAAFTTILAQTPRDADNLKSLGISYVQSVGNLKDYAPALPFDPYAADDIRHVIETRPTLLYASTHNPEEDIAKDIHIELQRDYPDLLTIIIPRHPKRGEDIATAMNDGGMDIARRSLRMSPRAKTDIYIADTLGETGLFYHLCPIVFVGNSMGTKPGGGHNLLEPAWHQCAIISGDDLHNFSEQATDMPKAEAVMIVKNRDDLLQSCRKLLTEHDTRQKLIDNAYGYVADKHATGMEAIIKSIEPTCQKAGLL